MLAAGAYARSGADSSKVVSLVSLDSLLVTSVTEDSLLGLRARARRLSDESCVTCVTRASDTTWRVVSLGAVSGVETAWLWWRGPAAADVRRRLLGAWMAAMDGACLVEVPGIYQPPLSPSCSSFSGFAERRVTPPYMRTPPEALGALLPVRMPARESWVWKARPLMGVSPLSMHQRS